MKRTEYIQFNMFTATLAELKAAERKQVKLENAGYVLVRTTHSGMTYRLEV